MYYVYYFQSHSLVHEHFQDLYISKFVGGVETVLGSVIDITNETFNGAVVAHTIRGEASGSTIKALFSIGAGELTLQLTVTDTAITGGMPGFDISSRPTLAYGGTFDQFADVFMADGDIEGAQFGQPLNC